MRAALMVVAAACCLLLPSAPATAGVGGVRYFSITGRVSRTGQVSWYLKNNWTRLATGTTRLGRFQVGILGQSITIRDPRRLAAHQCASLNATGAWTDGPLQGHLDGYICSGQ